MLQSCPHCADERDHQEKMLREQREQTRLLRDAAEQAESSRRRRELDDEHAQSARDWSKRQEEYALADRIRADEEEREQQRREHEQQRQLLEAELAARNYERDRLTTCPYCGQRYDEAVRKTPRIGYTWIGILGRFSNSGLCPKCYYDRIEKGEEKAWNEPDWFNYCSNRLRANSSMYDLNRLYEEVLDSKYPEVIADIKEKYTYAIIASFNEQCDLALRSQNIQELEDNINSIDSAKKLLYSIDKTAAESLITDELAEKLSIAQANLLNKAKILHQNQERQRLRQQAIEARRSAQMRVQAAETNLKEKRMQEQKVLRHGMFSEAVMSALLLGIVGGIGGSCAGCFNTTVNQGAISYFLMAAMLGFFVSLFYSLSFGTAQKASTAAKDAEFQLELAQAAVPPLNQDAEGDSVSIDKPIS